MFNLIAVKNMSINYLSGYRTAALQLVLMSEEGGQKNKESLSGRAEKVKIAYTLIGKGKGGRRKRTLSEGAHEGTRII